MKKLIFVTIGFMAILVSSCSKDESVTPTPRVYVPTLSYTKTEALYIGNYQTDTIIIDGKIMSLDIATLNIRDVNYNLKANFDYINNKTSTGVPFPIRIDGIFKFDEYSSKLFGEPTFSINEIQNIDITTKGTISEDNTIYTTGAITNNIPLIRFSIFEFIPNKSLKVEELRGTRIFKYYFKIK